MQARAQGSDEAEQLTRGARRERRGMEPWVVQQILVARHDRVCTSGHRESDEVVVVRVAKDRRRISRIAELDARLRDEANDAFGRHGFHAVAEVPLAEPASDLVEQVGADDRHEHATVEGGEEKGGRTRGVPAMPESSALASTTSRVNARVELR